MSGIYFIINTSEAPSRGPNLGRMPQRFVGKDPKLPYFRKGIDFYAGRWIEETKLELPLVYTLMERNREDEEGHEPYMPEFFNKSPPLVREDLLKVMIDEGVTNLQVYPAELHDPEDGSVRHEYKAINILGLVKAADLKKSRHTVHDGIPLIDVSFDRLVVDEAKTHGLLMFRLAENYTTILVHERLKQRIISAGFPNVTFWDPGEVAIL